MTDARLSRESVEVLARAVPDTRLYREHVEVLYRPPQPNSAILFRQHVEVLVRPYEITSIGPSLPIQVLLPDGTWRKVTPIIST